jgi:hypothetical protein
VSTTACWQQTQIFTEHPTHTDAGAIGIKWDGTRVHSAIRPSDTSSVLPLEGTLPSPNPRQVPASEVAQQTAAPVLQSDEEKNALSLPAGAFVPVAWVAAVSPAASPMSAVSRGHMVSDRNTEVNESALQHADELLAPEGRACVVSGAILKEFMRRYDRRSTEGGHPAGASPFQVSCTACCLQG